MWLKRPLYEVLPIVYMAVGVGWLIASLYVGRWHWPLVFTVLGLLCLTGGLVILLKRRDYRSSRSRSTFEESP